MVSRYWLATVVSAEETSTQIEVAFTRALVADGKQDLLDQALLDELAHTTTTKINKLPLDNLRTWGVCRDRRTPLGRDGRHRHRGAALGRGCVPVDRS